MAKPFFEIRTASNNKQYFVLLARNSKVILTSEQYESISGLHNGIDSVRRNVERVKAFKTFVGNDGQYYFNLIAGNNKVIGVSEGYKTKFGRFFGILSVKRNASKADVRIVK